MSRGCGEDLALVAPVRSRVLSATGIELAVQSRVVAEVASRVECRVEVDMFFAFAGGAGGGFGDVHNAAVGGRLAST